MVMACWCFMNKFEDGKCRAVSSASPLSCAGPAGQTSDPATRELLGSVSRGDYPAKLQPADQRTQVVVQLARSAQPYQEPERSPATLHRTCPLALQVPFRQASTVSKHCRRVIALSRQVLLCLLMCVSSSHQLAACSSHVMPQLMY